MHLLEAVNKLNKKQRIKGSESRDRKVQVAEEEESKKHL
jgi:hypothetical protein